MNDLDRLRIEYQDRKRRLADKDVYSPFNAANLFILQQRQRALIGALRKAGISDLSQKRILEMGCGAGGVLLELLQLGASPQNLFGADLLEDRLAEAKRKLPASHFINADGRRLPFPARSFDLVTQFTALSSVLDEGVRREIAQDMLRVLKPDGAILWYDFWWNPANRQTRGIRPKEIRALFPGCRVALKKITLAPPLARRIVPLSWSAALILESLNVLNSHYLGWIVPRRTE